MELNSKQHLNIQEEVKKAIIQTPYEETTKLQEIKESRLEKLISNPPSLQQEEIVIRVKRKRDDEPLSELYIDAPIKKTKPTIEDITASVFGIQLDKKQMVQKFSLRTNLKDTSKTWEIYKDKVKQDKVTQQQELKMIKLGKLRESNVDVIEITMAKNATDENSDYVYDYYIFESQIDKESVPSFMTFDEDLYLDNEYEEEQEFQFGDDLDSNDEDHPNNDYPDDDDEEEYDDSEQDYASSDQDYSD